MSRDPKDYRPTIEDQERRGRELLASGRQIMHLWVGPEGRGNQYIVLDGELPRPLTDAEIENDPRFGTEALCITLSVLLNGDLCDWVEVSTGFSGHASECRVTYSVPMPWRKAVAGALLATEMD